MKKVSPTIKNIIWIVLAIFLFQFCTAPKALSSFNEQQIPAIPDYADSDNWAALPTKKDNADRTPTNNLKDKQATAEVDVFFLHPTTYFGERNDINWNAAIDDPKVNKQTDETTILHQASIFNSVGKIYAPRYRQGVLKAFYSEDKVSSKRAFDIAYNDIKSSFEYYLEHYNNDRPIIIAAHSQGTLHAGNLVREFFDGKELQDKLVVAYLVGMPAPSDYFKTIPPCKKAADVGCFCSWRTYQKGHYPNNHNEENNFIVTNPLTWTIDDTYASKDMNEGAVLRNFDKGFYDELVDAQVHNGLLWATKPKFPGSVFIRMKNYHIADFNFYYLNVRKNAEERVESYLR